MSNPDPAVQERLYHELAEALFSSVPEDWTEIVLCIESNSLGGIQLSITGPAGKPSLQMPNDSLYEPAVLLSDLFRKSGHPFSTCTFRLSWEDEHETWRFRATYTYPNTVG